jgi:hypothetical protein
MKVIEIRKDNRTGKTFENSWGNNITSDFSIIKSVVSITEMLREQEAGKEQGNHNPVLDRFTTVAIRIEF